jgi:hypothetical protein
MGLGLSQEAAMTLQPEEQLVQEGEYLARVRVNLIVGDDAWSPYLSDADARRLDMVRRALKAGDIAAASLLAAVFRLSPVSAA